MSDEREGRIYGLLTASFTLGRIQGDSQLMGKRFEVFPDPDNEIKWPNWERLKK